MLLSNTKYVLLSNTDNMLLANKCRSHKYEKSIYVLKQNIW